MSMNIGDTPASVDDRSASVFASMPLMPTHRSFRGRIVVQRSLGSQSTLPLPRMGSWPLDPFYINVWTITYHHNDAPYENDSCGNTFYGPSLRHQNCRRGTANKTQIEDRCREGESCALVQVEVLNKTE